MDLTIDKNIIREISLPGNTVNSKDQRSLEVSLHRAKLPHQLAPGERILASTREIVKIPLGCVGYICLRSTFARMGLMAPSTVADPAFEGTLTMELFNSSINTILLEEGTAIWSVHFLPFLDVTQQYTGRYQGQSGVTGPKQI